MSITLAAIRTASKGFSYKAELRAGQRLKRAQIRANTSSQATYF
jgi:hypothetical protein